MSDSEISYDSGSDSSSESGSDSANESGSEFTYSSFQEALEEMMAGLMELDEGLQTVAITTQVLEKPVTAVAVGAFTNPRILESAPFRKTKFRLLPAAKSFLGVHQTVSFAELCAAIRQAIRERKTEVEEMWGTADFLGILQRLPEIVQ